MNTPRHTKSFAPFASAEWVESRSLDEYHSKWHENLATGSADSTILVAVIDEAIVGTIRVSSMGAREFDAQMSGMHVEPDLPGQGIGAC